MNRWFERRLTPGMIVRMIADALFVNAALVIALAGSLLFRVLQDDSVVGPELLGEYVQMVRSGFGLLTMVSLTIFYGSGLYARVRMYQVRYKLQIIGQAVSLSYVAFGFLAFMFPETIRIPRTALFLAWGLTIVFLVTARAWVMAWGNMFQQEIKKSVSPVGQKQEFSFQSGISRNYNVPINMIWSDLMAVTMPTALNATIGYGIPRPAQISYEKFFTDSLGETQLDRNGRANHDCVTTFPVINICPN